MHALFPYPGMFYWTLLNVHPAYRSSLRFIQLLAVAKSKDVKEYGIDAILEPAVKDLQVLARVSVAICMMMICVVLYCCETTATCKGMYGVKWGMSVHQSL